MITENILPRKQLEFNAAMDRYQKNIGYKLFSIYISLVNTFTPFLLFFLYDFNGLSTLTVLAAIFIAYIAADFINGIVHMMLDNNDSYTGLTGPFVASFHLHHRTPVYKKRNILLVYFFESGSKIWLTVYLVLLFALLITHPLPATIALLLILFAVFSCLAEVSHYCCHTESNMFTRMLSSVRILLPKSHHVQHHTNDNKRYAFLNGISDPLLDIIASFLFKGYKNNTDLHYAKYTGQETANR
ncbi:MAG: hypothetical protein JNL74_03420 [Fibrobacteres bacterium]|nr:hypothetical protein [Fibrobacterota bacterium]